MKSMNVYNISLRTHKTRDAVYCEILNTSRDPPTRYLDC